MSTPKDYPKDRLLPMASIKLSFSSSVGWSFWRLAEAFARIRIIFHFIVDFPLWWMLWGPGKHLFAWGQYQLSLLRWWWSSRWPWSCWLGLILSPKTGFYWWFLWLLVSNFHHFLSQFRDPFRWARYFSQGRRVPHYDEQREKKQAWTLCVFC